jgi:predicted AAA+ superfamily ATPase
LTQNLAICHIFYYFCDDRNIDAELSSRMLQYVKGKLSSRMLQYVEGKLSSRMLQYVEGKLRY